MSVINDMLRDLNKRQAPELAQGRAANPQSLIEPQKNTIKTLLFILLFVLVVAGITVFWFTRLSETLPTEAVLSEQNIVTQPQPGSDRNAVSETTDVSKTIDVSKTTEASKTAIATEILDVPEKHLSSATPGLVPEPELVVEENMLVEQGTAEQASVPKTPVDQTQGPVKEALTAPEKLPLTESPESAFALNEAPPKKADKPVEVSKKTYIEAPVNVAPEIEPSKVQSVSVAAPAMQVSLSPNARDQQMAQQARDLLARGQSELAYRELVAFLANHEVDSLSRSVLANYLLQENRLAEAGDLLLNAPIQSSASLRQLKARWYAAQGDHKMALNTLNSSLPDIKQYPEYHVLLAAYYQRFGWHKDALKTYTALIEYDDSVADWWAGLALAADRINDLKQAGLAYRQALELPGLAPELSNFASNRLKQLQTAQQKP